MVSGFFTCIVYEFYIFLTIMTIQPLQWNSLVSVWLREYAKFKTNHPRALIMILSAIAAFVFVFIARLLQMNRALSGIAIANDHHVEGLTNEEAKLDKNGIASPDPDLKCATGQPGSAPLTCSPADIIRIGYEISLDPRVSTMELENIQAVYKSRGAAAAITPFIADVMMLRASTMYNTDTNESAIQKLLDDMKKNKTKCYTNDFMATAKGFIVGTKEQKTLTNAQSEAVRCYAHRFNSIRKCLDACNNN